MTRHHVSKLNLLVCLAQVHIIRLSLTKYAKNLAALRFHSIVILQNSKTIAYACVVAALSAR